MIVLHVRPQDRLYHTWPYTRIVRLVSQTSKIWYCAHVRTGASLAFAKRDWEVIHSDHVDGYIRLEEGNMPRAMGLCEARDCENQAVIRVRHIGQQFCDWELLVCDDAKKKHAEKAETARKRHIDECTEGRGIRECVECKQQIEVGETYTRVPEEPTTFVHVDCLTDGPTRDTLAPQRPQQQTERGTNKMKDPVTGATIKRGGAKGAEDALPKDIEDENEPAPKPATRRAGRAAVVEDNDEPEAPAEKPVKPAKAQDPRKNGPVTKKTEPVEEPEPEVVKPRSAAARKAATASAPTTAKATVQKKAATTKPEKSAPAEKPEKKTKPRPKTSKTPEGQSVIRVTSDNVRVRCADNVLVQWIKAASEKDSKLVPILQRSKSYVVIKSEAEADRLTRAAQKLSKDKNTGTMFSKALDRIVEKIAEVTKEIAQLAS